MSLKGLSFVAFGMYAFVHKIRGLLAPKGASLLTSVRCRDPEFVQRSVLMTTAEIPISCHRFDKRYHKLAAEEFLGERKTRNRAYQTTKQRVLRKCKVDQLLALLSLRGSCVRLSYTFPT